MVQLHARAAGVVEVRPTHDVDALVDVMAAGVSVAGIATALAARGFAVVEPGWPDSPVHRLRRGDDVVDVLVADHLPSHARPRLRRHPVMAVDGGAQALPRSPAPPPRARRRLLPRDREAGTRRAAGTVGGVDPADRLTSAVRMRARAGVLHMDADAFFASVEQLQKPSLRGRPVLVGGVGPRGVVATASYEARAAGARSAMPMAQARRLCPAAAVLVPRFDAYHAFSRVMMGVLTELTPLVQPLSIDEAFADLDAGDVDDPAAAADLVRHRVHERTGLTVSVGVGRSKLVAKLASEAAKPGGTRVVTPDAEDDFLLPLPVRALWGVGPATAAALERIGVRTIADLRAQPLATLVQVAGSAHGTHLYLMARGLDDRPVEPVREVKSAGAERTFPTDLVGREAIRAGLDAVMPRALARLARTAPAARTVVVKVRSADFTTLTRSVTLPQPTGDPGELAEAAHRALDLAGYADPVRLLGVSFHALADHAQPALDLTGRARPEPDAPDVDEDAGPPAPVPVTAANAAPGLDVAHPEHGRGWIVAVRPDKVAVRFETEATGPGHQRLLTLGQDPLVLVPAAGPLAARG
jgi:DNA polymerase-4